MKQHYFLKTLGFILMLSLLLIFGCKRKVEEPNNSNPPIVIANKTIKALKAMHVMGKYQHILKDIIITGIVVANDKSGNFYKTICIQDSTAGISVKLEANNLYAQYPIGRQIFIRCKGLWLGDYEKLIQLGTIDQSKPNNPSFNGIPLLLIDTFIVKGSLGHRILPRQVSIKDFHDSLQSTLIQLKDSVQFVDAGLSYGDTTAAKKSFSRSIVDGLGNKAAIYTSGYASFAGIKTPSGIGIITCIYYTFKNTSELLLRDTSDVHFTGIKGLPTIINLTSLREMYHGSNRLLSDLLVKGVVISNAFNAEPGTIAIQDGKSGIDLSFGITTDVSRFIEGDSIILNVKGGNLTSNGGMLQIKLPPDALPPSVIARGKIIKPREVSLFELTHNISTLENTLVKISNVQFELTNGTIYSGNQKLKDATASIILNTAASAPFATATLEKGTINIIGYAKNSTEVQFKIRRLSDISSITAPMTETKFTTDYRFEKVTTTTGTADPTKLPIIKGVLLGNFKAEGVGVNSLSKGKFSFKGWPLGAKSSSNNLKGKIDLAKYYEVTIAPEPGYLLDLNSITFNVQRASTGVRQWAVRSSIDDFEKNLSAAIPSANQSMKVNKDYSFQITSRKYVEVQEGCNIELGASHTNLNREVKFRFYGMNAETNKGNFSLNKVSIIGRTH